MGELLRDLATFVPICLVISLVYASLRKDEAREILRGGLKNFTYFTLLVIGFEVGKKLLLSLT
jgi:hypothetical protein